MLKELVLLKIFYALVISGVLTGALVAGAIAGHSYHGYGMKMTEMSEVDSNEDGVVTFEELSAPTVDKLKRGFKMLDTNDNKMISGEEWDEFLKVHEFEKRSDS